ncbi:hypothetical protein ABEQ88_12380, partial [Cutibacterium acnes]
ALLMVWHLATLPKESAASAAQDEYARLMGKSSGAAKRDGFPGLAQMGETIRKELSNPFYDNGPNDKGIGIQLAYSLGRVGLGGGAAGLPAGDVAADAACAQSLHPDLEAHFPAGLDAAGALHHQGFLGVGGCS